MNTEDDHSEFVIDTRTAIRLPEWVLDFEKIKTVEDVVGAPVVGVIPFEKSMPYSIVMGEPVIAYNASSSASIGFMQLAATLSGENYEPPGKIGLALKRLRGALKSVSNMQIRMTQEKGDVESEMFIEGRELKEMS